MWRLFEKSLSDQLMASQPSTDLHRAAMTGNERLLEQALTMGSVDAPTDGGVTPLMLSSRGGHLGAVQLLVQRRASVNGKSRFNCTALSLVSA